MFKEEGKDMTEDTAARAWRVQVVNRRDSGNNGARYPKADPAVQAASVLDQRPRHCVFDLVDRIFELTSH